jgi:hypothetical protein
MPSNKVSNAPSDKQEYMGEPVDDTLANGPMENRSCTDVLCCLFFIAFLGGMIAIAGYSISKGDPNLIGRGYDRAGKICGVDDGYTDYPYLYFQVPKTKYLSSTICVKTCPMVDNAASIECKTNSINTDCLKTKPVAQLAINPTADDIFVYSSFGFVGRYCLPSSVSSIASDATDSAGNVDTLQQWFSDVKTTWPVIAVSLAVAFVIGFIYMVLMRYCSGVLTWAAILCFIVGNAILGWRFYDRAKDQEDVNDASSSTNDSNDNTVTSLKALAYFLWAVSALTFIIVLCLFSRIRLAIAIMKAASDYVRETMSVFLLPPFTCLVLIAFYVYWTITSLYLVSSGDKVTTVDADSTNIVTFDYDTKLKRLLIYHLFGLLWFNAFVLAATQFIISSSVCLWYFSQGTGQSASGTIRKSIYRLVRYHIGSIAFGSLIIAIIQMIRIMLSYAQYQAKKLQGKEGKVIKYALACLQCYVACFERFIRFLNKNAYIQIALTGKNFCVSAKNAFFLIFRNPVRFGVVAGIGAVFIAFGKIFIGAITALGAFLVITKWDKYSEDIYSPFFPTLLVFIGAYGIGAIFMTVYGLAADTILACFVTDEELSKKKNAPPRHCPESLKSFFDKQKNN